MPESQSKSISLHTRRFHTAFEKCPKNILPIQFQKIPSEACSDTSLILANNKDLGKIFEILKLN